MNVIVEISVEGDERPPAGAPLRVEARDTTYADAPSVTVAAAESEVRGQAGSWLETVELGVATKPDECTIWAHVDVDRDGRVSKGDFITMASYPVPASPEARISVIVRKVR